MRATLRTLAAGAAVCAALGFGAAAAWAGPSSGAEERICEEATDRSSCASCCYGAGAAAYSFAQHPGCVCIFLEERGGGPRTLSPDGATDRP